MPEFQRLAVVSRGEAAIRVINAVTELNRARETETPITTVAVHTDDDAGAWFVREADEHVRLEPEPVTDRADPRYQHADRYLDRVLVAIGIANADAVWVGWGGLEERWGGLEEHGRLAEACELAGVVFVGPQSATIRLLEDRVAARRLAERLGIPVVSRSDGTRGGDSALPGQSHLDDGERHLGVQIVADAYGAVWTVGVRDCSLRRGLRTVVAESSCPVLSPRLEEGDPRRGGEIVPGGELLERRVSRVRVGA